MKSIYNKIITGTCLLAGLSATTTSCGDEFLAEYNSTAYSTEYFQTEEGIISLATALYENIRWHFGFEWAYAITLYGTDEFTTANDLTSDMWNAYDARMAPQSGGNRNCPTVADLWNQMYYGISSANLIFANADLITKDDVKKKALGEAHFLRGYNYYRLFAQYGAVVLLTKPIDGPQRYFTRATEEETLNQIITDFQEAYNNLPTDKWRGAGTWTKYTAAHFLAKALLYRASERCSAWNSKYISQDLTDAIKYCDEVITACPLAADFNDLFNNWDGVDCAYENLPEILMSAQHNADASTQGRFGNRSYGYFDPEFRQFSDRMVMRGQFIGGITYQRCRPTEYNYSVYDNVNDARMWKSFKTTFGANQIHPSLKDRNDSFGASKIVPGDLGIAFILNKKDDNRFDTKPYGEFGRPGISTFIHPETNKWVPCAFPLFLEGKYVLNTYGNADERHSNVFCGLNKTYDGTRTAEKGDAHRDVTMARTGETYLIKAECLVRQQKYPEALTVVNQLRARGQWKDGEHRDVYHEADECFATKNSTASAFFTLDSGEKVTNLEMWQRSFINKNTYYLSTGLAETTAPSSLQIADYKNLPPEDEAVLAALGCTTDYDRMLNFIFNERTRELNGEWNRWEELSRTKLLVPRTRKFNKEVAFIDALEDKHILRPIPQSFIDGLTNEDGSALTDEQKKALQNPGY